MIVYGKQIFFYLLERHPQKIRRVYLQKRIDPALFERLKKLGIEVVLVDPKKAQALAKGGNHQGFLIEIDEYRFADLEDLKDGDFLVVLHGLTDVGNIGSIVRTAYALGVDGIVVTGLRSLAMEGVIRRSSGAALDMPIALRFSALEVLKELKDVKFGLYVADMDGVDVRKERFLGKRALILGSEGEGVPKKLKERCDKVLRIVMKRPFDSLNVSAAAAIFIDRMRDE
ncbi:MAG: 23S rRNA (guanosine(2251)-2'-O)-methyltransferase RlmB [Epsilonproteobacteria bacterium]|nr:23S rRNA (guanosine(2251)-2'-O)-methyltransferase RlmB [Campylobacterota bacterium]NPA63841.1 23S rRNA (guanosine(2251)-2'-O)-methyltransferase RlmB [Campylobacterota bacterium]